MIKANELRIGNWIKSPNKLNFRLDKMENWGTNYSKCCMVTNPALHDWTWELKDMEPIPLTPEILEKCGFKYIKEVAGYCDKDHVVYKYKSGFWGFNMFCANDKDCTISIKYLHQLQNLYFSLTGTELNIEL